jgi:hypothetical protein
MRDVPDTQFLGAQTYNHLNCNWQLDRILPKLSTASFVIRQQFYVPNLKTLRMAYIAYFHSIAVEETAIFYNL